MQPRREKKIIIFVGITLLTANDNISSALRKASVLSNLFFIISYYPACDTMFAEPQQRLKSCFMSVLYLVSKQIKKIINMSPCPNV